MRLVIDSIRFGFWFFATFLDSCGLLPLSAPDYVYRSAHVSSSLHVSSHAVLSLLSSIFCVCTLQCAVSLSRFVVSNFACMRLSLSRKYSTTESRLHSTYTLNKLKIWDKAQRDPVWRRKSDWRVNLRRGLKFPC